MEHEESTFYLTLPEVATGQGRRRKVMQLYLIGRYIPPLPGLGLPRGAGRNKKLIVGILAGQTGATRRQGRLTC